MEVLDSSLNVLLAEGARFKVARSMEHLYAINSGDFGVSQIGKFIAVYPSSDAHAVQLAVKLDEVTRGRRGPRVPSDRPLRPDSLVHYWYGAMLVRPESEVVGEAPGGSYQLLDPARRLTRDVRPSFYVAPAEAVDPFETAGVYIPRPPRPPLLNGRYLVVNALAHSPRGGVFRAVDFAVHPARLCLLKEFLHDVAPDHAGNDARDWASNEESILVHHAADPLFPAFIERFELDGNAYLAVEYVEGRSLELILADAGSSVGMPPSKVAAVGLGTAPLLAHLHEIGLIFRDFKPANVIQTSGGDYRLIDFGLACRYGDGTSSVLGGGTPEFCSPEQYEGKFPEPSDDVFAWGATLHYLACGESSLPRRPESWMTRRPFPRQRLRDLNPAFPMPLAGVIERAVALERADRYPTMGEAMTALAEAARLLAAERPAMGGLGGRLRNDADGQGQVRAELAPAEALVLARQVGDALCSAAEERDGGLCWSTRSELSTSRTRTPDLYSGAAGTGLFLAELAHATGTSRYAEAARGVARWLSGPAWSRGWAQHGLHGGEPGVAYFYLRLAELLEEPAYLTAAELRIRRLTGVRSLTIDLMHGTAGTVLALTRLYSRTSESRYLEWARAGGDELITEARGGSDARSSYWDVPSPEPGGASLPFLGLLHGAAGIGLALVELAVATDDERYLDAASRAASLLLAQARRSQSPAGGLTWPRIVSEDAPGIQAHCHGAGGIAQFFLRLHRIAPDPRHQEAAGAAARTLEARIETEARSGICHGLSGTGHVLIDAYQALRDQRWLAAARRCGTQLQRFQRAGHPGVYDLTTDEGSSPDLMLGFAGAGSLLLRLAAPDMSQELILR